MRTYILSLIASEFVSDIKSLQGFFSKTFYAKQYGDSKRLNSIISRMIDQLKAWKFLKGEDTDKGSDFVSALKISFNQKLEATLLGKRVSELYLDPYTANFLIENLKSINKIMHDKESGKEYSELTILHVLCSCLEMRPLLRVKSAEYDKIIEFQNTNSQNILQEIEPYDEEYDDFLNALKTSMFFTEWLSEKDEEFLLEKYDVRPGEIYSKLEIIDWLLYSCNELSRLLKMHPIIKETAKLRYRMQYGVKEELIPLLQLKNIGRVRARALFNRGIKDIGNVKKIELSALSAIIGKAIAPDIKKQVG